MGQLQGSYLSLYQPLAVNDYLCSPSLKYFALMQSNGNFCIYKGKGLQDNQALIWATLKCGTAEAAKAGKFYAVVQSDGNFCIYQGSGPDDNQGYLWGTQKLADGGQFFAAMQDDGNFVVYMGTGPDDNRGGVWDAFSYPMNPIQYNVRMSNVEEAFNAVSKDGNNHSFTGEPWVADIVHSHVQGITDYHDYFILTHSNVGYDYGYLMVLDNEDKNLAYKFNTPDKGYNHPGGCQRIGSILVVPMEHPDGKSIIRFYNLTDMTDSDNHKPKLMDLKIERPDKKAGGVGITSRQAADGLEFHYLAVSYSGDKKIDFYKSNGRPLTDSACSFTLISTVTLEKSGYSEICLVTESNNYQWIYLVGFRVEEEKLKSSSVLGDVTSVLGAVTSVLGDVTIEYAYKDYVDLYRVFAEDWNFELVKTRHVTTHYGNGVQGTEGVHFRWGAGLKIMSETQMKFYATQRNFVANHIYTNTFT